MFTKIQDLPDSLNCFQNKNKEKLNGKKSNFYFLVGSL